MLSPLGGRARHPLEGQIALATQVNELRCQGSIVETVTPDAPARSAFGSDMMDLSARSGAARTPPPPPRHNSN
ncbi:MAG: hypothetical protein NVS3B26_20790 [Mycobacteriales bacterium]